MADVKEENESMMSDQERWIESVGEECEILISLLAGFISHRVVLVKNPSYSPL